MLEKVYKMVLQALAQKAKIKILMLEVLYQYLVEGTGDIPDPDTVAQALFEFGLRGLLPSP